MVSVGRGSELSEKSASLDDFRRASGARDFAAACFTRASSISTEKALESLSTGPIAATCQSWADQATLSKLCRTPECNCIRTMLPTYTYSNQLMQFSSQ